MRKPQPALGRNGEEENKKRKQNTILPSEIIIPMRKYILKSFQISTFDLVSQK
jgi:hypothetical protein